MVGEEDYRTPQSEAEQYYQALRLRGVPTRLVLIPGAPHNMTHRPTGIAQTTGNVLAWFAEHGGPPVPDPNTGNAREATPPPVVAGANGQRGN
jgi:acylaminoacyl-peptidase